MILRHIKNIFEEREFKRESTVANFATVVEEEYLKSINGIEKEVRKRTRGAKK